MPLPRLSTLCSLPVLLGAAVVVLSWHVAMTPQLYDAGELVAAAWFLGASHPPGQPLHGIVGHAIARVPIGSIPYRLGLLSLACELTAAAFVFRITGRLIRSVGAADRIRAHIAPFAAASAAFLSPPLFRQALRPEVYGLALTLCLASIDRLIAWGSRERTGHRDVYCGALVAGVCTTVHPPHALAAIAMGVSVVAFVRRDWLRPLAVFWTAIAFGVGLGAYVLLPVRDLAGTASWGSPATWAGFIDYVSASAYRQNLIDQKGSLWSTLPELGLYLFRSGGFLVVPGLCIAAASTLSSRASRLPLAVLSGTIFAALPACLQPLEPKNPDNVAYAAPALALLCAVSAAGFARTHKLPALSALCLALFAVNLPSWSGVVRTCRLDEPALDSLEASLTWTPPPRALVVVETDFVASTWMASQAVDRARPDVAVFVVGLATSSWHWRSLNAHPAFDGQPHRGAGPSVRDQYVNGAVQSAVGRVPVLSESDRPVHAIGTLAGPYLYWAPSRDNAAGLALNPRALAGERLVPTLGDDYTRRSEGESEADDVIRWYEIVRARRLVLRGETEAALQGLARACSPLSSAKAKLFHGTTRVKPPLPTVARDPNTLLASREDAIREAAALLWASGSPQSAKSLLEDQYARGDPRSLLQLGWLYAENQAWDAARQVARACEQSSPSLRRETLSLSRFIEASRKRR